MSNQNTAPTATGERQSLSMPIELEEGAPPHLVNAALTVISSLMIGLLVLSNLAQVREFSMAAGAIASLEQTREVAHLEGGIVKEIIAKPGTEVTAGAPLIELRAESADDSHARFLTRASELKIRIERLSAMAEERKPEFTSFKEEWPSLVEEHQNLYHAAREEKSQNLKSLDAQIASADAEFKAAKTAKREAREQLSLSQEQFNIQDELIKDGFTSRQALLEAKSSLSSSRAALADATSRYERSERALQSATADRERMAAQYQNAAAEERTKARAELLELEQSLISTKDRDNRLIIRAPVAGIVNDIAVGGAGAVVRPGAAVAQIVPSGAPLIGEVRLNPKDIGHIDLGQRAEITVTTFDPKRDGVLKGVVSHISADTFLDDRTGEYYYKAQIEVQQKTRKERALTEKLSAGMEIQVKVITRSRSLMTYLLKPVANSLDGAFSER